MLKSLFEKYGTGILLAATGVGAGDLITSGLAGLNYGTTLLWTCIFGAFLKYVLSESISRYQMATNKTILEGITLDIHQSCKWIFLIYLIMWSFFVGAALINAAGISLANIIPLFDDYSKNKIFYGISQSIIAIIIVCFFSFEKIERIMSGLIFIMFVSVITTSIIFIKEPFQLAKGLFIPSLNKDNLTYAVAVMGGVGGTLTILSYSYWLKEKNWSGENGLQKSKSDLKSSYILTGLFSISMIILGSQLSSYTGPKSSFPIAIAKLFESRFGILGYYIFLIGFWNAVFSSLLGVWQSVPYLFTDFFHLVTKQEIPRFSESRPYRYYLVALGIIPIISLWYKFEKIQLAYAISGALFIPILALVLIILTNKKNMKDSKSSFLQNTFLMLTLIIFAYFGILKFF